MSKSYNPFKMWGSYVGSFALFVIGWIIANGLHSECFEHRGVYLDFGAPFSICKFFFLNENSILDGFLYFSFIIIFILIGFLIGWGIHSLVRALRK